ncbi:hypothetical protein QSU92_08070 [Microbacterium sp. ET2]|uniref:hypothetical protein n=1 Tax=Microbacterium albipurpureum TaxID=3050384 RepID=UPI00259CF086|nr:hypothetical protein [Microbacterium sp. ET2 (Ac-2212)]WJL97105.1 hypothetical protein QSU92_08070 [Microbacterium sp. ET2 (Ac-2212)]
MRSISLAVGQLLSRVFAGILVFRHPRPIHPHGVALFGQSHWIGSSGSGIRWIDEPPAEPQVVTARASRSLGVPAPLPDIVGLAIRFHTPEGFADLELASTGLGVPARFALRAHGSPSRARLTTLLPHHGAHGSVLIAAVTVSPGDLPVDLGELAAAVQQTPWRLRLLVARPAGRWHPFAELELRSAESGGDSPIHFDAGQHMLPGATMPTWVRNAREPSYRLTRRHRSTFTSPPVPRAGPAPSPPP